MHKMRPLLASVTMLLALTDQFGKGLRVHVGHAQEVLPRINDEYRRHYYAGVICERWAKVQLSEGRAAVLRRSPD